MKIVFRADASVDIGTGHVMRCLTLATELQKLGHDCSFICRKHDGHLADHIAASGFKLHLFPNTSEFKPSDDSRLVHAAWLGTTWREDVEQTILVLTHDQIDWLIVDHYALDARWEQEIERHVKRVMVIDDLADRQHVCSLLLDQNLGRKTCDYENLVAPECKILIGPNYALLRSEFAQLRSESLQRRREPIIKRILISMGGVDSGNITSDVLKTLEQSDLSAEIQLDVVMGQAAPHLREVKQLASQLRFHTTVNVNVSDMAERMCVADLSIGAAGSTAWERCCLGLPSLIFLLADNQCLIANALNDYQAAVIVEKREKSNSDSMLSKIEILLQPEKRIQMSQSAASVTDGKGAMRVVKKLEDSLLQ
ncbi:UDP-2,4-diacetamido-2,4,6-trideoxy-beta-L-altropyranose hydrolase [Methylophaga sp. OBS3]|uniref:UDP-2,4-diacetamido-2,4, 6-trideoxy-beta-L-altropyranose hydrolase n=1 Tax=Methylophaga sp. OBS3 TaxID=2991934 RepID=UPI00225781E7|nr:UDP-2,4-diacetamido-2,4,6-trideoxy-beta-L-altropyranose hydrolase [Methylophaga sp. OBS3]MCX4190250.1 UDP-2,4-diacetamido-2,4,6-trideoxy-beta-L-altropyranose hydrolase [Methylophaga sp. OBS3]